MSMNRMSIVTFSIICFLLGVVLLTRNVLLHEAQSLCDSQHTRLVIRRGLSETNLYNTSIGVFAGNIPIDFQSEQYHIQQLFPATLYPSFRLDPYILSRYFTILFHDDSNQYSFVYKNHSYVTDPLFFHYSNFTVREHSTAQMIATVQRRILHTWHEYSICLPSSANVDGTMKQLLMVIVIGFDQHADQHASAEIHAHHERVFMYIMFVLLLFLWLCLLYECCFQRE